ncbi:MAG: hypothetical protein WEC58_00380 [Candidatus Paceibacterota bacterium]
MNNLTPSVETRFFVLGEIHGACENVHVLRDLLHFCGQKRTGEKTVFAFEWLLSSSESKVLNEYILGELDFNGEVKNIVKKLYSVESGAFSDQHLDFLAEVRQQNIKNGSQIKIICFDSEAQSWNQRDKEMAEAIMRDSKDASLVIIVTGSLHARKQSFTLEGEDGAFKPLATYLPVNDTETIRLHYKEGVIFNFGRQKITKSDQPQDSSYYDNVYVLESATPVTYEQKKRFDS